MERLIPTCYVHVGTHKTGTTSIQNALASNEGSLAERGLFVPRAGRPDAAGGHHNVAWELNGDERFNPAHGTFADVLNEIAAARAPRICLTSEDFEYLHDRPAQLLRLADGIRRVGYAPAAIVYLRPQAGYAESLYAELVKHGLTRTFDAFLDEIIVTGEYQFNGCWRFTFDYERLLGAFAGAFGDEAIIVRRYDADAGDVVADFLSVVGGGAPSRGLPASGRRLNAGLPFDDVLRRLERNALAVGIAQPVLAVAPAVRAGGRFDPVHLLEVRRIVRRFNAGNRRNGERFGVSVPCVSGRDLIGDVLAASGIDPASTVRRRLVDAQSQRLTRLAGTARAAQRPRRRADLARRTFEPAQRRLSRAAAAVRATAPARIEAIVVVTTVTVGLAAFVCGSHNGSTALIEFGMLSAILGASAAGVAARCAVEAQGIVTDEMFFARWGRRLRVAGFALVGVYALVNALLDVGLPRHEPDLISYPGAIAAAVATLASVLVLPLKTRLLGAQPAAVVSVRDDRLYVACAYITVVVEVLHAVSPAWWLETGVDVIVAALAVRAVRAAV